MPAGKRLQLFPEIGLRLACQARKARCRLALAVCTMAGHAGGNAFGALLRERSAGKPIGVHG